MFSLSYHMTNWWNWIHYFAKSGKFGLDLFLIFWAQCLSSNEDKSSYSVKRSFRQLVFLQLCVFGFFLCLLQHNNVGFPSLLWENLTVLHRALTPTTSITCGMNRKTDCVLSLIIPHQCWILLLLTIAFGGCNVLVSTYWLCINALTCRVGILL